MFSAMSMTTHDIALIFPFKNISSIRFALLLAIWNPGISQQASKPESVSLEISEKTLE